MSYQLLSFNNPKTKKGEVVSNYLTAIMHLSPINTKICPYQDIAGCKEACLNTAGRGGIMSSSSVVVVVVVDALRRRMTEHWM